jgi:hypothetical protein
VIPLPVLFAHDITTRLAGGLAPINLGGSRYGKKRIHPNSVRASESGFDNRTIAIRPAYQSFKAAPADVGAPTAAAAQSQSDLKALVAPIALYPDKLVAIILSGATFPIKLGSLTSGVNSIRTSQATR